MAEAVPAEDPALLIKDDLDNLEKDLEAWVDVPTADANTKGSCGNMFAFLYHRSTYYWIAFIAQLSQVSLQGGGLAVAVECNEFKGKEGYTGALFLTSGIYSTITFLLTTSALTKVHFRSVDKGPKHVTAEKLVAVARLCAIIDFGNLVSVLAVAVSRHSEHIHTDEIRPVIVPLIVGLLIISFLADITAAYITYAAAKRARGTDPVPDPDYRVPAWTLATTEESQGLWRQNAIQLPL